MPKHLIGMFILLAIPIPAFAHSPCFSCRSSAKSCCAKPKCSCHVCVHYCKGCSSSNNDGAAEVKKEQPATTNAGVYAPVVQASAPAALPAMFPMPIMMPMMMPQQYQQQPVARQSNNSELVARVDRLESGVKHLSERMDKIEDILNNNTAALNKLADLAAENHAH